MDPGEIFRAHHISNFGKENTRDNRLRNVADFYNLSEDIRIDVPYNEATQLSLL